MCQSRDIGSDSLYCGDLDLDTKMPNVELVGAISIHYNMFQFQVDSPIIFELSCTQTHRQTHRRT